MGQPVTAAVVTISGDRPPVRRTVQTDANGMYRFEYLLPGEYALEFQESSLGTVSRTAVVQIGRDTQVDVVLGTAFQEELTVTAATPLVDIRSTEVSVNYNADLINTLPLDRSYRGLFQLIPGVADNRSSVGPAAGGNRQDNTYLMDGVNITNPGFGYLGTEINELDIAEINIKRAGVSAEFGRTGGTVTNAVSRSGTNQLSGVARIDWQPSGLVNAYELPAELISRGVRPGAFRDPLLTTMAGAATGIGGPVVQDRVFFYGSARYFRRTKWDRFNKVGTPLPDEVRSGPELSGKLTSALPFGHQLAFNYRYRPIHMENASLTSEHAPTLATTRDNGSRIATAEWTHFRGSRLSFTVRFLHMREENEDVPARDLGLLPPFDPQRLEAMGQFTDPARANLIVGASQFTNIQNYRRNELRGTATRFFDAGRTSHALKAGAGYEFGEEKLDRLANGWGQIAAITVSGVPALRARYYTPQAPQFGQGLSASIFVQDEVAIAHRTTVNAGLLLSRDEFAQRIAGSGGCPAAIGLRGGAAVYESAGDRCTFLRFGFFDEIQPRLGVSRQLRERAGDKLYVHWGRFYNMDQKSSARSLAPVRIFQTQTIFDLAGNVLSSGPLASTTGKWIDPDLKPIYTDELLVGYAVPIGVAYSLEVYVVSRSMHNIIEDLPSRLGGAAPDAGPFVAANLPCRAFAACREARAERTYRAFTIEARRRPASGWMADLSYTWSRFEGNFDLDYAASAVFNTSSIIQDGPGTNVEDPNRFGPLLEDRPHVFKLFASYAATSRVLVSAFLRVQSGSPWAARARDWAGAVLNYLEPAGAHRNPTWANFDLLGSYRLPLHRSRLTLEARLMNAFNSQTQLSTDSQQYLDLRTIATPPYFAPYLLPNPLFGTGNAFAPPRRLALTATLEF